MTKSMGQLPKTYHFQVFCLHSSQFSCNGSFLVVCPGLNGQASFFSVYLRCLGDSARNLSLNYLWTLVNANFIFPKLTSSPIMCLTSPFGCLMGMSSSICSTQPNSWVCITPTRTQRSFPPAVFHLTECPNVQNPLLLRKKKCEWVILGASLSLMCLQISWSRLSLAGLASKLQIESSCPMRLSSSLDRWATQSILSCRGWVKRPRPTV